ncbi:SRPBCC family protein [Dactylosporangium sp. NPDC051484]|uniref:SRPBCC family protein n=1 Tax=Dactylosporangium sp. NPDC051484 TaxID=3154942 RepID=UPI00344C4808
MLLTNEFVVARPIDETWAVLTDIERIAPCMPGAQLTGVSGDEYQGKVKVKVGPMTAQFSGTAVFKEQDAAAHRAVIEAKGRDASGKGRASALVTAVLSAADGATKVRVETDLNIAGPLAQMGRSTIADISTRLLTQFVDNLENQLTAEEATAPAVAEPAAPVVAEPAAPVVAEPAAPVAVEAQPETRVIDSPEAEAVDLTKVAGTATLVKLAVPIVVVIAAIVALVVWLA